MFYYELYSWDDCIILSHEKRFPPDKFSSLCEEVDVNNFDEIDLDQIVKHLVENHGFNKVRVIADYFINNI